MRMFFAAFAICTGFFSNAYGYTVSGRVTSAEGAGVGDAEVRFYTEASMNAGVGAYACTTGDDGGYSCSVADGEYYVGVFPPPETYLAFEFLGDVYPGDPQWSPVGVHSDTSGLDVVVEKGGRIDLRILDRDGQVPQFDVFIRILFLPDARQDWWDNERYDPSSGVYTSSVFPPGRYLLSMTHNATALGYLDPQYYCGTGREDRADVIEVRAGETAALGACRMIDREPDVELPSLHGALFDYDEGWLVNASEDWCQGANSAGVADFDQDGLVDILTHVAHVPLDSNYLQAGFTILANRGENRFVDEGDAWFPFSTAGGCRAEIGDVNGDGFPDIFLACAGEPVDHDLPWGEQDRLWINVEGDHFVDETADRIPIDDPEAAGYDPSRVKAWTTNGARFADLDGDGDLDLLRNSPEAYLVNDGDGHFSVGARSVDIANGIVRGDAVENSNDLAIADLNGDGHLDVFVAGLTEHFVPEGEQPYHVVLLNDGSGNLSPMAPADSPRILGPSDVWAYAATVADFDGDGLRDVYVANIHTLEDMDHLHTVDDAPLDQLLRIVGLSGNAPVFEDASDRVSQSAAFNKSWNVTQGDIDNDGDVDILVANHSWGYDLSGLPEIRVLLNDGSGSFEQMPMASFPQVEASLTGISPLDSDDDGDLDLFLWNGYCLPVLLINRLLETYDLSGNGYVDAGDFGEVVARFGDVGDGLAEDVNQDGAVDALDLSLVLRYQTTTRADDSKLAH